MAEAIEAYYTAPTTGLGKQALLATGWGYLVAGDLVCAKEVLEEGRVVGVGWEYLQSGLKLYVFVTYLMI